MIVGLFVLGEQLYGTAHDLVRLDGRSAALYPHKDLATPGSFY